MLETLLNGGPFMMVLLIIVGSIIFISVKNIKEPYNTNGIVLLGIFSALVGILATYLGVNAAFSAVPGSTPFTFFKALSTDPTHPAQCIPVIFNSSDFV